jgi:hypothetical protein
MRKSKKSVMGVQKRAFHDNDYEYEKFEEGEEW